MANNQEKFNFDITPEYFKKINIYPFIPYQVAYCFLNYEYYNDYIPRKIEENYKKLEQKYLDKLPFKYQDKVNKVKEGMKINQTFFSKIANLYLDKFNYVQLTEKEIADFQHAEMNFVGKIYLEFLTREWAEEGKEEREKTITPVIQELKSYYDYENKSIMDKGVNVLVIGARFFRVVYELAKLGYNVEANEKNYFYLMVANYLFNYAKQKELCICPRISSFCSSFTEESVTRKHYIPDVDISADLSKVKKDGIKITKQEFEDDYKDVKDKYDCVITVFSTDDFKNLISFTEKVNQVLKKGGIWINIGGLSNAYCEFGGIDLTWDEWKHVIMHSGFDIKKEERPVVPYCKIKGHSLPFTLGAIFFTAQKI